MWNDFNETLSDILLPSTEMPPLLHSLALQVQVGICMTSLRTSRYHNRLKHRLNCQKMSIGVLKSCSLTLNLFRDPSPYWYLARDKH